MVFHNAISPKEIVQLNQELNPFFQSYPNSEGFFYGDKTKRFGGIFAKSKTSHRLATHPDIITVMNAIMGPYCDTIQINLTQAISIQPGETAQMMHRDDEMFPFPHPGIQFMINCMWALTPFTAENGGTRIYPNSHHGPFSREDAEANAIAPTLKPGDLLIYLGSTVHGGGANCSSNNRNGLVISYSQGWLRQSENQYLANPPKIAAAYSQDLQKLIGYEAHKPNLGWVEGQDPSITLKKNNGLLPTIDLLPKHLEDLVKAMAKEEAA